MLEYHNTGYFALPGGFVRRGEHVDDAVKRGLRERTGLDNIYLEQFHTFGAASRAAPDVMRKILEANDYEVEEGHWLLDRFISVAYYALINYNEVEPQPDELSDSHQLVWPGGIAAADDGPPADRGSGTCRRYRITWKKNWWASTCCLPSSR